MPQENSNFYYNSTALTMAEMSAEHYHSLYEIYYLEKGICKYLIEDELFELLVGDVVFIPKGAIHKTSYEDMHSRLLVNCSDEYIRGVEIKKAFVYRNKKHSAKIYSVLKDIEREYLYSDRFSNQLIKGYVQQILAIVHRTQNEFQNTRVQNKYAVKALDYLNDNFSGEITLVALAQRLSVSPEHLSRIFKKETGLGFNEYLSLLRLKKAESVLKRNDNRSISEIAFDCGFNDSNYFCEKFKSVYGMSPLKFKKSFKV